MGSTPKMAPSVTIAIPTYNRADQFLGPALERALGQTWSDIEIVVSDNCSTDRTQELVASYSDPRIDYVRQETNIGPNNNFNFCVQRARGNYFLLYHDDDFIDYDFVASCMDAAGGNPHYGIIRTGTRLIDGDGNLIREIPNTAAGHDYVEFFRGWMRTNYTSYVCSTLFNTKLLQEIGGFQSEHGLYQDLMAIAKLIARAGHCDVEDVKASFRIHDENFGNFADLKAWCEDGVQLAQIISTEAPYDNEALYRESLKYLCWTVYRYAGRFLPDRRDRMKAYRMIDREFGHCYPAYRYLFDKSVRRNYKVLDRKLRNVAKRVIRRDAAA